MFAWVVAGVNEIAASTAATVNRWRIVEFLVYVSVSTEADPLRSVSEKRRRVRKDQRGDVPTVPR
jgi:hypothetical protein